MYATFQCITYKLLSFKLCEFYVKFLCMVIILILKCTGPVFTFQILILNFVSVTFFPLNTSVNSAWIDCLCSGPLKICANLYSIAETFVWCGVRMFDANNVMVRKRVLKHGTERQTKCVKRLALLVRKLCCLEVCRLNENFNLIVSHVA